MSAALTLVQAGASAPAVSLDVLPAAPMPPRLGEELALVLAASEGADRAASEAAEGPTLDAERLTVYHVALELQCMANTLVPSVNRVLRDQFERASLSCVLNLAEAMCSQCLLKNKTFRTTASGWWKLLRVFEFGGHSRARG